MTTDIAKTLDSHLEKVFSLVGGDKLALALISDSKNNTIGTTVTRTNITRQHIVPLRPQAVPLKGYQGLLSGIDFLVFQVTVFKSNVLIFCHFISSFFCLLPDL